MMNIHRAPATRKRFSFPSFEYVYFPRIRCSRAFSGVVLYFSRAREMSLGSDSGARVHTRRRAYSRCIGA